MYGKQLTPLNVLCIIKLTDFKMGGKEMNKRKTSFDRVFVYAIVFLLISLTCIGCRQTRTRSNSEKNNEIVSNFEEKEEPLIIFNVGGSTIPQDFQLVYPELECEIVLITESGDTELEEKFHSAIAKHGEPDLIIDGRERGGIQNWIEQQYALNISDYFDTDNTYNNDVYYPGVESVGRVGGQLYAFPLGLQATYMTVRDDLWEDSTFSKLPENYTSLDLLYAMKDEMDYWMEQDAEEYRWVFQGEAYDVLGWLWESGALQATADGVTVDREILQLLIDGWRRCEENVIEYQKIGGSFSAKFDPREGRYSAVVWGDNLAPQFGLLYDQSMNQVLLEQNIHVLWRPLKYAEIDGVRQPQYAASVAVWGMVGANSKQPERAYQALRQMMDVPLHGYGQPNAIDMPFSVNRQEALNMIETANQGYVDKFVLQFSGAGATVQKQPLNNELKNEMERFFNNISLIYVKDESIERDVYIAFMPYSLEEEVNYDLAYTQILEAVQRYAD